MEHTQPIYNYYLWQTVVRILTETKPKSKKKIKII